MRAQVIRTPRRVVRALRERERLVRFLRYVVDLQGWIADDPFTVDTDDIIRAEAYGWVVLERFEDGAPAAARVTALGRAAAAWGEAHVFPSS